jgi:uridine kinase
MRESLRRGARAIADLPGDRRVLVAVDGVDGAGKTTFADALLALLARPVVRASADDFLHRREVRYRLDAVLILDGLFLHRPELRARWDLSILLDVPPEVAAERQRERDGEPPRARYVRGQELYLAEAEPARHASLVLPW